MTTNEIYKLAEQTTKQRVDNVVADWEAKKDKALDTYKSLVRLGDSPQVALFTAISGKYKNVDVEMYVAAYHN